MTAPALGPTTRGLVTIRRQSDRMRRGWLHHYLRSGQALIGSVCILLVLMLAFVGPLFAGDPMSQDLLGRLKPPVWAGGDPAHPLGTDLLGRDVFARLAGGVQNTIWIVLAAMAASIVIGTVLGLLSGYFGGWLDAVVMRVADVQLAFPEMLLVLLVIATLGPGVGTLMLVLAVSGWVLYSRVVRSQTLSLKQKEFIDASHALGARHARTMLGHILPNLVAQITVIASFSTAHIVLIEASLSFLGLGVPPPSPSLGGMISDGQPYLVSDPWLSVIPGVVIFLMVVGINLLADWLRGNVNPSERSSR